MRDVTGDDLVRLTDVIKLLVKSFDRNTIAVEYATKSLTKSIDMNTLARERRNKFL